MLPLFILSIAVLDDQREQLIWQGDTAAASR
jgi:hypothetical protein